MIDQKDPTIERYLNGDYAEKNPDWDSADAIWKASKVKQILASYGSQPSSLVEIGCGSGAVLAALRDHYPKAKLAGYDISPDAQRFWNTYKALGIHFELADYLTLDEDIADVVLILDVLEHLGNPWSFLAQLRDRVNLVVVHFPLDLSVLSVIREKPLLHVRDKVGHLHYFTRNLALALMEDSGFEVLEASYTGAGFNGPTASLKTRIAGWVRGILSMINRDLSARILGGETLMVIARPRAEK